MPSRYKDYVCTSVIDTEFVQQSFDQAKGIPHRDATVQAELTALEENHTWQLVVLPAGKKPIGCKWDFQIKHNSDGTITKHKACLVAKSFHQHFGEDYNDSFAHVAKKAIVLVIFSLAASFIWALSQLDMNNTFLHGDLEEDIYMTCPPGLTATFNQVCKLMRSLYDLKQAPRQWNFSKFLLSLGFANL